MKLVPLLITGSLAANATFFSALAWRPTLAPPVFRDFFTRHFHAADEMPKAASPASAAKADAPPGLMWESLRSDDLPSLMARLRAAGFPPNVIRSIIAAQISARYNSRIAALL